ncbi:MAG: trypsin-like serine protease [Bryobacterales bacterium]|nr:trypsin-like serine protease [Bryobacterales bacterium]
MTAVLLLTGSSSLLSAGILTFDNIVPLSVLSAESHIVAAPALGTPGDINDAAGPFRFPRGIGLDGTVALTITKTTGTFLCSGAMIGSTAVLAAAHCFADNTGNNITTSVSVFAFPNGTTSTLTQTVLGSQVHIPDQYTGTTINDYDIAVVRLPGSFGTGVNIYDTFGAGDTITTAPFTVVGFGGRGAGATGNTLPSGQRRRGFNNFDAFLSPAVLISDFDNGLSANDTSCLIGAVCHVGLGNLEASTAPGDSGGPVFLNGKIVAVSSFGARLTVGDIDGALNSTFGEINGFVSTRFHEQWLDSILAIPEPGTWFLSLAGLGALTALRRRTR